MRTFFQTSGQYCIEDHKSGASFLFVGVNERNVFDSDLVIENKAFQDTFSNSKGKVDYKIKLCFLE